MKVDTTRPPVAPPNREGTFWPFVGWVETKESKQRTQEYHSYLTAYGNALDSRRNGVCQS